MASFGGCGSGPCADYRFAVSTAESRMFSLTSSGRFVVRMEICSNAIDTLPVKESELFVDVNGAESIFGNLIFCGSV